MTAREARAMATVSGLQVLCRFLREGPNEMGKEVTSICCRTGRDWSQEGVGGAWVGGQGKEEGRGTGGGGWGGGGGGARCLSV